jgi:hypothetical protein
VKAWGFGAFADDRERHVGREQGQDVLGKPCDALALDEAAGCDDEVAARREPKCSAGGARVGEALDTRKPRYIDAIGDDARSETAAGFDGIGSGSADCDDAFGAEGPEGGAQEEPVAGKGAGNVLTVDGDERGGSCEELEEWSSEREEAIAEVNGAETATQREASPGRGRDEKRQPALPTPERTELEGVGVVADELPGELLHAADGGRELAGDEEDHGERRAGEDERDVFGQAGFLTVRSRHVNGLTTGAAEDGGISRGA